MYCVRVKASHTINIKRRWRKGMIRYFKIDAGQRKLAINLFLHLPGCTILQSASVSIFKIHVLTNPCPCQLPFTKSGFLILKETERKNVRWPWSGLETCHAAELGHFCKFVKLPRIATRIATTRGGITACTHQVTNISTFGWYFCLTLSCFDSRSCLDRKCHISSQVQNETSVSIGKVNRK